MKNCKNKICLLFVAICLNSCASITPQLSHRSTVQYDGNNDDSGLVQFLQDGSLEITPTARERYNNAILNEYGVLKYEFNKDFGVTKLDNGNYSITKEGLENWHNAIIFNERTEISK